MYHHGMFYGHFFFSFCIASTIFQALRSSVLIRENIWLQAIEIQPTLTKLKNIGLKSADKFLDQRKQSEDF